MTWLIWIYCRQHTTIIWAVMYAAFNIFSGYTGGMGKVWAAPMLIFPHVSTKDDSIGNLH